MTQGILVADFVTDVAAAMTQRHPNWASELGVVAVSGGADSVALCCSLLEAQTPAGIVIAHLNHQLRGAESDADEDFVRTLAARLCKTFYAGSCPVQELGGNLEATARKVRYEWLTRLAKETGAGWIATGHTADDQAETILHRLIRGSGISGLRGIAGARTASEFLEIVPVVRPLLSQTRSEVLAFLVSRGQPFRTDSSNADLTFTRNRIRAELLPLLRTFNPNIVDTLCRLANQAEEQTEWMETQTRKLLQSAELPRAGGTIVLDTEKLSDRTETEIRALLREVWHREHWPVNAMTFEHWKRAAAIALRILPAADFPDGVHIRLAGKVVQLRRRS